jgi:hypothetical protein
MQDGCLAGAACDANSRRAQGITASQNSAFRSRKCHGVSGSKKEIVGNQSLNEHDLDEMRILAMPLFLNGTLAMR